MENYFAHIMNNGLDIMSESPIAWPDDFSKENKIILLNKMIEYFNSIENFNACAALSKSLKDIKQENSYGKKNENRNRC